ncbi:transporter substrate-binding domain-containing protein [Pseudomaricurvus alkylphenolicus]|jgi:polar amino acid transport system substrate-binding protein|uniref:substrate-binding periplasmic protein n=1 Tax=Pseudomaricurvus alkylphenolicus TaxID=1306991 RepID=UPI00141FDA61|nr:transporter substrate-binding domain-containing protein [Pseudomaricurvus alkylphenolicus]NIB41801.1 transporter substrate-binding domain-containing protein [Pseudomaricurvus alkylphenolicus]
MRPLTFTIFFFWLLCCTSVADDKILKVGAFDWPTKSEAGGGGAYFDLLKRIYEPHGYRIEPSSMGIDEALGSLYRGNIDLMLAEWHPRHLQQDASIQAKLLTAPFFPIDTEYVVVLMPHKSSYHWEELLADAGMRLAWVEGYDYHQYLDLRQHTFDTVDSSWKGIRMVSSGKLDAFIDDLDDVRIAMMRPGARELKFRREVILVRNLYPLFQNKASGHALSELYDEGLEALISNGEVHDIYRRHDLNWERVKFLRPHLY